MGDRPSASGAPRAFGSPYTSYEVRSHPIHGWRLPAVLMIKPVLKTRLDDPVSDWRPAKRETQLDHNDILLTKRRGNAHPIRELGSRLIAEFDSYLVAGFQSWRT